MKELIEFRLLKQKELEEEKLKKAEIAAKAQI